MLEDERQVDQSQVTPVIPAETMLPQPQPAAPWHVSRPSQGQQGPLVDSELMADV